MVFGCKCLWGQTLGWCDGENQKKKERERASLYRSHELEDIVYSCEVGDAMQVGAFHLATFGASTAGQQATSIPVRKKQDQQAGWSRSPVRPMQCSIGEVPAGVSFPVVMLEKAKSQPARRGTCTVRSLFGIACFVAIE